MNIKKLLLRLGPSPREKSRQKRILNILLIASIFCFFLLNIIRVIDVIGNPNDRGMPIIFTLAILAFFLFLFFLSKRGYITIASILLILAYAFPVGYSFILWGADLPAALLLSVLLITMSGALLGAQFAVISTITISSFLVLLTQLQTKGIVKVASYWRSESHTLGDAIAYVIILSVIATIAWLFCQEIQKALKRAKKSEEQLKKERDSLEKTVIERTKKIKRMEAEKINQLYRLAEFGRLSSGIFHDLINPLSAVSLNLEQISINNKNKIINAKSYLNQAVIATHKMERLIASIKNQIQRRSDNCNFSINQEIHEIMQIMSYKARRARVKINLVVDHDLNLYGDAIKFNQIVSNLVSNAIEACEQRTERIVGIVAKKTEKTITVIVTDNGYGIDQKNREKIFNPFFSTKDGSAGGLGLGLSSTKHLIEKGFGGTISFNDDLKTNFVLVFPAKNE